MTNKPGIPFKIRTPEEFERNPDEAIAEVRAHIEKSTDRAAAPEIPNLDLKTRKMWRYSSSSDDHTRSLVSNRGINLVLDALEASEANIARLEQELAALHAENARLKAPVSKQQNDTLDLAAGFLGSKGHTEAAILVMMLRTGTITKEDRDWADALIQARAEGEEKHDAE